MRRNFAIRPRPKGVGVRPRVADLTPTRHAWRPCPSVPARDILPPAHQVGSHQVPKLYPGGDSNCRQCARQAGVAAYGDRQVSLGGSCKSRNFSLG